MSEGRAIFETRKAGADLPHRQQDDRGSSRMKATRRGLGYYLLTGRHIHDTGAAADIIRQDLDENPGHPPDFTGTEIPRDLKDLIVRCLARSPQDRYATMMDVIENFAREGPSNTPE